MSKERFVCKKRKRRPSSLTCLAFFLYIPYAYIKFYKSSTFLVSIKKKKKGFSLWIRLIVFTKSYLPKTFDCRNFVLQFQPVSRLKKVKKKKMKKTLTDKNQPISTMIRERSSRLYFSLIFRRSPIIRELKTRPVTV